MNTSLCMDTYVHFSWIVAVEKWLQRCPSPHPQACEYAMHTKSLQSCPTVCDPWITVRHASLSMGFSRQKYWSGLLFPPSGDLPNSGIKPASPVSPALQVDPLPAKPLGKPLVLHYQIVKINHAPLWLADRTLISQCPCVSSTCLQAHFPSSSFIAPTTFGLFGKHKYVRLPYLKSFTDSLFPKHEIQVAKHDKSGSVLWLLITTSKSFFRSIIAVKNLVSLLGMFLPGLCLW